MKKKNEMKGINKMLASNLYNYHNNILENLDEEYRLAIKEFGAPWNHEEGSEAASRFEEIRSAKANALLDWEEDLIEDGLL